MPSRAWARLRLVTRRHVITRSTPRTLRPVEPLLQPRRMFGLRGRTPRSRDAPGVAPRAQHRSASQPGYPLGWRPCSSWGWPPATAFAPRSDGDHPPRSDRNHPPRAGGGHRLRSDTGHQRCPPYPRDSSRAGPEASRSQANAGAIPIRPMSRLIGDTCRDSSVTHVPTHDNDAPEGIRSPDLRFRRTRKLQIWGVHSPLSGTAARRSPNGTVAGPVYRRTPALKRPPSLSRRWRRPRKSAGEADAALLTSMPTTAPPRRSRTMTMQICRSN